MENQAEIELSPCGRCLYSTLCCSSQLIDASENRWRCSRVDLLLYRIFAVADRADHDGGGSSNNGSVSEILQRLFPGSEKPVFLGSSRRPLSQKQVLKRH
jgi:hypothetical protein